MDVISYLLDIRERVDIFTIMVMLSTKHFENSMTVRMGYALRGSTQRNERAKERNTPLKRQGQERIRVDRQKQT